MVDEDAAYIETLDLGEYLAWLTKTGKMESILKDLGRLEKWRKQAAVEEEEEEEEEDYDCPKESEAIYGKACGAVSKNFSLSYG